MEENLENKEEKTETKSIEQNIKEEAEKLINCILEEGIQASNIDFLSKIVDIHKDISNEEYWKVKKEDVNMRYRAYGRDSYGENEYGNYNNYGNYGEYGNYGDDSYGRRGRDSRGRYTARGYDKKYQGEDMIDEMYQGYQDYSESKEQYNRGNYSAKEDTMKSFKYMLKAFKDYYKHLKQEASSQEETKMLEDVAREMIEM